MRHGRMQAPDNMYRQSQDGDICQDIWHCVPDKRALEIDASTWQGKVPGLCDRVTLEYAHADDCDNPSDDNAAQNNRGNAEASRGEYTSIHEQDRNLDDSYCCAVYAFETHEQLMNVSLDSRVYLVFLDSNLGDYHDILGRQNICVSPHAIVNHWDMSVICDASTIPRELSYSPN